MIEAMAREKIPVVGHLGLVPRHVTWTNHRSIGKSLDEAKKLYHDANRLESAGAYAAELECVPDNLASLLSKGRSLIMMSLGSGSGCDTQFLFSDDILGDYDDRLPRHAKAYRNFLKENQRLQHERIKAFGEYISDINTGSLSISCARRALITNPFFNCFRSNIYSVYYFSVMTRNI